MDDPLLENECLKCKPVLPGTDARNLLATLLDDRLPEKAEAQVAQVILGLETAICLILAHPEESIDWKAGNSFAVFAAHMINCLQHMAERIFSWKENDLTCTFFPFVSSSYRF